MAYKTEDGKTKHKTLWIVLFWNAMMLIAFVLQVMVPTITLPTAQIVTVAGSLSTAYVATDKGVKIATAMKAGNK